MWDAGSVLPLYRKEAAIDIILWLIVGAFVLWEVYAHVIGRNKSAHTLSNRIWWLEQRYPKTRVLTAVVLLVLALHLLVRWI